MLGAAARVGHLFQAHIIHGLFQVTVLGLDKRRFVPLRIPKWEIFSSGAIVIELVPDRFRLQNNRDYDYLAILGTF